MTPNRPPSPAPPLVNGRPTTLLRVNHADLPKFSHLESLFSVTNAAFLVAHGPPYFAGDLVRVKSSAEMIAELVPTTIAYVLTQPTESGETIVVGAVMEELADDGSQRLDERYREGEERSDVRFLVVNPAFHRQGVGAWLMLFLDAKMKQRVWQKYASEGKPLPVIRLVLKTAEEVTAPFYTRLGWRPFEREHKPVGTFGSPTGWTMVSMEKILTLEEP